MAYFANATADGTWHRLEPRKMFIVLWVGMYAIVLLVIWKGGLLHQGESVEAPAAGPSAQMALPAPAVLRLLMPIKSIAQGTRLRPELFTIEEKTLPGSEDRVLSDKEPLENLYAISDIQLGAPVLKEMVGPKPASNLVISQIPLGYRAVTISVNAESGVEGWVRPGSKVDVVWISTVQRQQAIVVIVDNAEVISAEHSVDPNGDPAIPAPTHVTLKVLARDAQKIQLAKVTGTLSLNLRGSDDNTDQGIETITVQGLMRKDDPREHTDSVGWVHFDNHKFDVSSSGKLRGVDVAPGKDQKKGNEE